MAVILNSARVGELVVTRSLEAPNLSITGQAILSELIIGNSALISGSLITNGSLSAGTSTLAELLVGGNAHVSGSIVSNGSISASGNISAGSDVVASGNLTTLGDAGVSGTLKIGEGENYTTIDPSGFMRAYGGAVAWADLLIPVSSLKINPGTSKPDYGNFITPLQAFLFDDATEEGVTFIAQIPHNWKVGSEFEAHVHWAPITADAGTVIWGLRYSVGSISGVMTSMAVMETTANAPGVANTSCYNDIGDIEPSGMQVSSMIACQLYRRGNIDSYGEDVALLGIDFHYQIDGLGSKTESGEPKFG